MLFWTIIKVCLASLWANKLRSFLAMLGIIFGVGAVITMLAIGTGAKQSVLATISAMGTNLLVITPGNRGARGVTSGTALNLKLTEALTMRSVEGIQRLAPVVNGRCQAKYASRNEPLRIVGTTTTYFPIRDFTVERGRCFTESEVDGMARVVVIGPTTVETLFGLNDPLGQTVKIKGVNFKVVGVTKAKGDQGYFNPDDQAILPYTTAMKQMLGLDYIQEIDVQAAEGTDLTALQDRITVMLRKAHRIQPWAEDDFNVRNQADIIQRASDVTQTFTFLLGGVASVSLLVGGIGIMNIMLVTVTERTREIGIRKAIGARERSILTQFLVETLILSGLGGLLGVVAGVGAAWAIPKLTSYPAAVDMFSILLALSFSVAVGIFFGWYPARRAASLAPVDALRYE